MSGMFDQLYEMVPYCLPSEEGTCGCIWRRCHSPDGLAHAGHDGRDMLRHVRSRTASPEGGRARVQMQVRPTAGNGRHAADSSTRGGWTHAGKGDARVI